MRRYTQIPLLPFNKEVLKAVNPDAFRRTSSNVDLKSAGYFILQCYTSVFPQAPVKYWLFFKFHDKRFLQKINFHHTAGIQANNLTCKRSRCTEIKTT